jgi:hypothetical protein
LPHLRPSHGATHIEDGWLRATGAEEAPRLIRISPILPAQPSPARVALAVSLVLLCAISLGACGGGSSVSDVVPKSTPDITPPSDTSAEKASVQSTSTSTTSTTPAGKSSEGSSGEETKEGGEASSGAGSPSGESESSKSEAGGTSAGGSAKEESATKGEAKASPTGGAGAP